MEEQYNMVQAQQTTVEEPELPEAVAVVESASSWAQGFHCLLKHGQLMPYVGDKLYTATHMHDHFAAGVRAGAAESQDGKREVVFGGPEARARMLEAGLPTADDLAAIATEYAAQWTTPPTTQGGQQ